MVRRGRQKRMVDLVGVPAQHVPEGERPSAEVLRSDRVFLTWCQRGKVFKDPGGHQPMHSGSCLLPLEEVLGEIQTLDRVRALLR